MNIINKIILYVINLFLYILSGIYPKDKNLWLFGAWFGQKYSDNSKYLFEYININQPNIRAVWLTSNPEVEREIKKKGFEVYRIYSFKSILLGLRAKYAITSHANFSDLMPFLNNKKVKSIQLWHGAPLKKIGLDDTIYTTKVSKDGLKYRLKTLILPFLKERIDLISAIGEEDKKHFMTAFATDKVEILGYPRNDVFLNLNKTEENNINVLYLPTFRGDIGKQVDLFSTYDFDVNKFDRILEENNIKLHIKMHPVNKPPKEIYDKIDKSKNIFFLQEVDVSEYLTFVDVLITDYSSVYFDFLLTERPIVFAPFDLNNYLSNDRNLYYDYNKITPGPHCRNWNEVIEWIIKFRNDKELFLLNRREILDTFHTYRDKSSSELVYFYICNNLK